MKKEVLIYTFNTCPYCKRAKMLLDEEKISYTEIDITNQRNKLKELELKTEYHTVPQIFVGDKFIGGCDDLLELHRIGDFDKIFR